MDLGSLYFNNFNFKKPKRDMALVAVAGPISNLIMALISVFVGNVILIFTKNMFLYYAASFFYYVAQINVGLAVFNLIPVPPLDGSRVLGIILPDRIYFKIMQYERYIYFILLALLFTGFLDGPLYSISKEVLNGIISIASLPFKFLG